MPPKKKNVPGAAKRPRGRPRKRRPEDEEAATVLAETLPHSPLLLTPPSSPPQMAQQAELAAEQKIRDGVLGLVEQFATGSSKMEAYVKSLIRKDERTEELKVLKKQCDTTDAGIGDLKRAIDKLISEEQKSEGQENQLKRQVTEALNAAEAAQNKRAQTDAARMKALEARLAALEARI